MPIIRYKTEKQRKNAILRSDRRYKKKATVMFSFRFHKENDNSGIEKLRSVPNKNDYIRQLILSDIGKED